jgi:hypothetical protein
VTLVIILDDELVYSSIPSPSFRLSLPGRRARTNYIHTYTHTLDVLPPPRIDYYFLSMIMITMTMMMTTTMMIVFRILRVEERFAC